MTKNPSEYFDQQGIINVIETISPKDWLSLKHFLIEMIKKREVAQGKKHLREKSKEQSISTLEQAKIQSCSI